MRLLLTSGPCPLVSRSRAPPTSVRSTVLASLARVSVGDLGYDERLSLARGELGRLILRLRSLSLPAWRPRRLAVIDALTRLAELSGRAEHRDLPAVPAVADHALADAVAVIGGDVVVALAADPDDGLLAEFVATVQAAREATR